MINEHDETEEMMSESGKHAVALCEHLMDMGAEACRIPITLAGTVFEVSVKVTEWPSKSTVDSSGNLTEEPPV